MADADSPQNFGEQHPHVVVVVHQQHLDEIEPQSRLSPVAGVAGTTFLSAGAQNRRPYCDYVTQRQVRESPLREKKLHRYFHR
jgi:hypothetical protein